MNIKIIKIKYNSNLMGFIAIFLAFIILLFPLPSHAGMDFTGLNNDRATIVVPDFQSKNQAELWAKRTGYNEQIRRQLKSKILAMRTVVASLNLYSNRWDAYREAGDMMQKVEFLEIALRIIEKAKDSAQVGAAFYAGMEPLNLKFQTQIKKEKK